MSCTGYWVTPDGCCEKCGKPTAWKELCNNWHIWSLNYCNKCRLEVFE